MVPHSWGFLDHTQRRTTVGRTPLDEWSVRRRDLYLTTQNTHNRKTPTPSVGFERTIPAGEQTARPLGPVMTKVSTETLMPQVVMGARRSPCKLRHIYPFKPILNFLDRFLPIPSVFECAYSCFLAKTAYVTQNTQIRPGNWSGTHSFTLDRLWDQPQTTIQLVLWDSFPHSKVAGAWGWPLASIWCRS